MALKDRCMVMIEDIAENLSAIRRRMEDACRRAGRGTGEVELIGVTKTVPLERIREGVAAGVRSLGENYVQEAQRKLDGLADLDVTWHFIGHLQSNKARHVVGRFHLIHTVDRLSLARELDKLASKAGGKVPILLQVNIGDELSKSGVHPDALFKLHDEVARMEGLEVRGLMILPPYLEDPEEVRPYFRKARELLLQLRERSGSPESLKELSMGMSHDFDVAIEEGATMIRVGTALFGVRPARYS